MNVPAPAPPLPLRLASQAQRLSSELLQNVFIHNSVQERAIFSRSCKRWREAVIEHELFWRVLEIPKGKDLKVFMLEYFTKFSKSSLTSVIINAKVPEEDLEGILEILEESGGSLSELHITQHPSLNSRTRTFARNKLLSLQILSTTSLGYRGGKGSEKQFYLKTLPTFETNQFGRQVRFHGDVLYNFQKERNVFLDQQVEAGAVKRSFKFWFTDPEMKAQWERRRK